jgi:hypothetical protein
MINNKLPNHTYSITIKDVQPSEKIYKQEYEHINSTLEKSPRRKYTGCNLTSNYLELISGK